MGEGEHDAGPSPPTPGHDIDSCGVELSVLPSSPRKERAVAMAVARVLELPLSDARQLLERLPVILPRSASAARADEWVATLREAGASASPIQLPAAMTGHCATHPGLQADGSCARCKTATCALCSAANDGVALCGQCLRKGRRSRTFYRARVAVLLAVLACVLLWAWRDVSGRRARTSWSEPLSVGIIVVQHGPVDEDAILELRQRTRVLQQHLAAEFRRFAPGAVEPFHFIVYGPVNAVGDPPAPTGDGWLDQARTSYELWRYLSPIDEAAGLETRGLDSRVYLIVRPPAELRRRTVEGMSEDGGRIGIVEVELDDTMVDFALFVAAHELFHTLGATDKYDATGRALVPEGIAEPDRIPLYPQRYAEIMARLIPLGPMTERPPEGLEELRIGIHTAREIGWYDAPP